MIIKNGYLVDINDFYDFIKFSKINELENFIKIYNKYNTKSLIFFLKNDDFTYCYTGINKQSEKLTFVCDICNNKICNIKKFNLRKDKLKRILKDG